MSRLEEAAAEEEAPQGRGCGRGCGCPPLRRGALGARARGDGAPPPPPEDPEAEAGQGGAERGQPEPDQPPPPPPNLVEVMALQTQLMQRMAEAMEHRGNGGNRRSTRRGPHEEDRDVHPSEGPHLQLLG
jgi:hypothetical protein